MNEPMEGNSRRVRRKVSRDRWKFELLVWHALAELPPEVLGALENIAVVIEDEPSFEQLKRSGYGAGDSLYGLYEGIPFTERSSSYSWVLPDKISIFQKPIEEDCRAYGEMKQLVKQVVRHELAHYFGYTDEDLSR